MKVLLWAHDLAVWMRNLLGIRDDLQSQRESIGIGRLDARVGELGLGGQAPFHEMVG